MTKEQQRRLDALESATNHISACEMDYLMDDERNPPIEPFSIPPWTNVSGEVNVIYDRSGNVERVVRHDVGGVPIVTNFEGDILWNLLGESK